MRNHYQVAEYAGSQVSSGRDIITAKDHAVAVRRPTSHRRRLRAGARVGGEGRGDGRFARNADAAARGGRPSDEPLSRIDTPVRNDHRVRRRNRAMTMSIERDRAAGRPRRRRMRSSSCRRSSAARMKKDRGGVQSSSPEHECVAVACQIGLCEEIEAAYCGNGCKTRFRGYADTAGKIPECVGQL